MESLSERKPFSNPEWVTCWLVEPGIWRSKKEYPALGLDPTILDLTV
jgi:hypothetical protein